MKHIFELNRDLFRRISAYRIQLKDVAESLGKSPSALTQNIKNNSFTMLEIATMAEYGSFTHGSFMKLKDGDSAHTAQVVVYHAPVYRLYLINADLEGIFGSQKNVAEQTGINEDKLRILKQKVYDEQNGWVSAPDVLEKFLYRDFLTLLSYIDNVDPWRYINDDNGCFPVGEEMTNKLIPASSYSVVLADKESRLNEAAMAAEELRNDYDEMCRQKKEADKNLKKLKASLKEERKGNRDKHNTINNMRAINACRKKDLLNGLNKISEYMDMLEKLIPADAVSIYQKLKQEFEKLKNLYK